MKAVSPVIATLILIAIAVIAGIFVLRQFLFMATTTGTQQYLQIVDAVLYLTTKTMNINATYSVDWISVTLQITVKNTGDKVITVKDIKVDPQLYPVSGFAPVNINPGNTYSGSFPVILNKETGETRILYNPAWEKGTQHTVFVTYRVLGSKTDQTVSQNVRVM